MTICTCYLATAGQGHILAKEVWVFLHGFPCMQQARFWSLTGLNQAYLFPLKSANNRLHSLTPHNSKKMPLDSKCIGPWCFPIHCLPVYKPVPTGSDLAISIFHHLQWEWIWPLVILSFCLAGNLSPASHSSPECLSWLFSTFKNNEFIVVKYHPMPTAFGIQMYSTSCHLVLVSICEQGCMHM